MDSEKEGMIRKEKWNGKGIGEEGKAPEMYEIHRKLCEGIEKRKRQVRWCMGDMERQIWKESD